MLFRDLRGRVMAEFHFNQLLADASVPIDRTKLVRHQDKRGPALRTPYHLLLAKDGSLERYQELQSVERFHVGDWLASFVAMPLGETVFVGMFECTAVGVAPAGTFDPISGSDVSGAFDHKLERKVELSEYIGRLVIEWGGAYRAWIQLAKNQDKPVVELRKSSILDSPFPGTGGFRHSIRNLTAVPENWRAALAVRGVYVLTSTATGKQYVGSATGDRGFWGRWEEYFRTGHGGNVGMRPVVGEELMVSILEVAASTASELEILAMEKLWKERLLTREFGLNKN
jgi:hypothetical protein